MTEIVFGIGDINIKTGLKVKTGCIILFQLKIMALLLVVMSILHYQIPELGKPGLLSSTA